MLVISVIGIGLVSGIGFFTYQNYAPYSIEASVDTEGGDLSMISTSREMCAEEKFEDTVENVNGTVTLNGNGVSDLDKGITFCYTTNSGVEYKHLVLSVEETNSVNLDTTYSNDQIALNIESVNTFP